MLFPKMMDFGIRWSVLWGTSVVVRPDRYPNSAPGVFLVNCHFIAFWIAEGRLFAKRPSQVSSTMTSFARSTRTPLSMSSTSNTTLAAEPGSRSMATAA